MTPLQSGKYTNIFSHYRPIDDPEWFLKSNPIGTPEPIIDIDEAFQRSELHCKDQPIQEGEISDQCNSITREEYQIRKENWIKKTMPYLSSQNEKIVDGSDLYRYWEKVNHLEIQEPKTHDEL